MDWAYMAGGAAVLYLLAKREGEAGAHPLTGMRVAHAGWGTGVVVDAASDSQLYVMFDGDSEPSGPYNVTELTAVTDGG